MQSITIDVVSIPASVDSKLSSEYCTNRNQVASDIVRHHHTSLYVNAAAIIVEDESINSSELANAINGDTDK